MLFLSNILTCRSARRTYLKIPEFGTISIRSLFTQARRLAGIARTPFGRAGLDDCYMLSSVLLQKSAPNLIERLSTANAVLLKGTVPGSASIYAIEWAQLSPFVSRITKVKERPPPYEHRHPSQSSEEEQQALADQRLQSVEYGRFCS